MAARATRSASRKARLTEAVATGPLGALSHDELGVIFDGLADPLQPVVAVALSSTCLGLRTPLQAALEVLKERHARAVALGKKVGWYHLASGSIRPMSCAQLRSAEELDLGLGNALAVKFTADDMATLAMILPRLQRLQRLSLDTNNLGDAGMQALCDDLNQGAAPFLRQLNLMDNLIRLPGIGALATALGRGALPNLATLILSHNKFGSQGVVVLAPALRKLPALRDLLIANCEIGDEGVASLVANLGKNDFKSLKDLSIGYNQTTGAGMARLVAAIDAGCLPALDYDDGMFLHDPASASAVKDALAKRRSQ